MSVTVDVVTDEKELKEIYKLRYKVYCQEWGYDNHINHSTEIITDVYDEHAVHFAARDETKKIVGAIMLIMNSPEGYPLEKYCELNINKDELPRENLSEVSRLVIHREYRRRAEDNYIYGNDEERRSIGSFHFPQRYPGHNMHSRRSDDKYMNKKNNKRANISYSERRERHEVVLNLYKAMYQESKKRNITHWYSFMTKGILTLLSRFGFDFEEIGDSVDYHGIRTPYLGEIVKIEQGIINKTPELYDDLTRNL
jgi:N-acyl-L-homoserine lactone synthetase